jgi:2-dehydro-3-deoxyphosphogluconate aldolase/(4S)-4-hydroxy-2-oxoglutarate aldolase
MVSIVKSKDAVLALIRETGIVPAVRAEDARPAIKAIEAIYRGGVRAVEIIVTVPGAFKMIEEIVEALGEKLAIGAGTVLDKESARNSIAGGADFLAGPCFNPGIVEVALHHSKPVFAGGLTPTEVLTAWKAGADAVKVYPCGLAGGPKYIRSLKAPFPEIEMIANGGVTLETVSEYLKAGALAVGVGSGLVDATHIQEGRFVVFEERARRFIEAVDKTHQLIKASTAD